MNQHMENIKEFTPNPKYIPLEELNSNVSLILRANCIDDFKLSQSQFLIPKNQD